QPVQVPVLALALEQAGQRVITGQAAIAEAQRLVDVGPLLAPRGQDDAGVGVQPRAGAPAVVVGPGQDLAGRELELAGHSAPQWESCSTRRLKSARCRRVARSGSWSIASRVPGVLKKPVLCNSRSQATACRAYSSPRRSRRARGGDSLRP